jgi:hypothetical protein
VIESKASEILKEKTASESVLFSMTTLSKSQFVRKHRAIEENMLLSLDCMVFDEFKQLKQIDAKMASQIKSVIN